MKYVAWREPSEKEKSMVRKAVSIRLRYDAGILLPCLVPMVFLIAAGIVIRSFYSIVLLGIILALLGVFGSYLLKIRNSLIIGNYLVMEVKVTRKEKRRYRGRSSYYVHVDSKEPGKIITTPQVFELLTENKTALLIKYPNKIKRFDIVPL